MAASWGGSGPREASPHARSAQPCPCFEELLWQDLQRHGPLEARVLRPVDLPIRPPREARGSRRAETCARRNRHGISAVILFVSIQVPHEAALVVRRSPAGSRSRVHDERPVADHGSSIGAPERSRIVESAAASIESVSPSRSRRKISLLGRLRTVEASAAVQEEERVDCPPATFRFATCRPGASCPTPRSA